MTSHRKISSPLRVGLCILALAAAVCTVSACRSKQGGGGSGPFPMGQRVQAGPLTYIALETQWKPQLKDGVASKIPNNRYLLIKLSMTNSGGQNVAVPHTILVDSKGNTYPEVTEGTEEVSDWLGLLRNLAPAQTEQGYIVFDVPVGAYKLKVSDGGDIANERTVLIDIPLQLDSGSQDPTQAPTPAPE